MGCGDDKYKRADTMCRTLGVRLVGLPLDPSAGRPRPHCILCPGTGVECSYILDTIVSEC